MKNYLWILLLCMLAIPFASGELIRYETFNSCAAPGNYTLWQQTPGVGLLLDFAYAGYTYDGSACSGRLYSGGDNGGYFNITGSYPLYSATSNYTISAKILNSAPIGSAADVGVYMGGVACAMRAYNGTFIVFDTDRKYLVPITTQYARNTWYNLTMKINQINSTVECSFVNSTHQINYSSTYTVDSQKDHGFGLFGTGSSVDGVIDEFKLYTGYTVGSPPAVNSINMSPLYPIDGATVYNNVNITVYTNHTTMANFSLFIDNVFNTSINRSSSTNQNITFFKNLTLGVHNATIQSFDGNYSVNTTTNSFNVVSNLTPPQFPLFATDATLTYPQIGDYFHINSTIAASNFISFCVLQMNDTGTGFYNTTTNITLIPILYNYLWQAAYQIIPNTTRNVSNATYRVWCNDTGLNYNVSATQKFTVRDTVKPTQTYGVNNNVKFDNTSHISGFMRNVTINYTIFDYNLFAYELDVTCDISGKILSGRQIDINSTTYTVFNTTNVSTLPLQHCYANLQMSDDHTDEIIPDYVYEKTNDYIEYKTDTANIAIKSLSATSVDTQKNFDRYNFEFDYDDKKPQREFIVQSDYELYQRNSKYPGHFVSWNDKTGMGNWIDFNSIDAHKYNYAIERINSTAYKVIVSSIITTPVEELPMQQKGILKYIGLGEEMTKDELTDYYYGIDNIEFSSIGGLNVENITAGFWLAGSLNITNLNIYGNTSFDNGTVYVQPITASNMTYGVYPYLGYDEVLENLTNGTYYLTFEHPQYFNQTYFVNMTNVSQNLSYATWQAQLNLKVRNGLTGEYLANYSSMVNQTLRTDRQYTTDTNFTVYYLNATTYNTLVNFSSIYINKTNSFSLDYKENKTLIEDIGFYVKLYLMDERTNDYLNISAFDTIYFQLFCPDATYQTLVTTNITAAFNCSYSKFRFVLGYTSTTPQSYYRSFILPFTAGVTVNQSIYLINPFTTNFIANNFVLDDLLNNYANPRIYVTKNIGNATPQISADYVDAEKKVTTYLMLDNEYYLWLYSDNNAARLLGTYVASVAGDRALHLYDIQSSPSISQETFRNGVWVYQGLTNISNDTFYVGMYNDTFNKTTSITLTLFKTQLDGVVLYTTTIPANDAYFMINISAHENETIYGRITAIDGYGHTDFDQLIQFFKSVNQYIVDYKNSLGETFGMDAAETQRTINWFFILLFSLLALTATVLTAEYMGVVLILGVGLLAFIGWINVYVGALLGAAALIAVFSLLKKKDREEVR